MTPEPQEIINYLKTVNAVALENALTCLRSKGTAASKATVLKKIADLLIETEQKLKPIAEIQ